MTGRTPPSLLPSRFEPQMMRRPGRQEAQLYQPRTASDNDKGDTQPEHCKDDRRAEPASVSPIILRIAGTFE
jgi:hypothetical protein